MPDFDTTTWVNDSTPGIADQQLNRIESGILDAAELSKQRGPVAARPPASNAYKNWLWIAADLGNALSYCDGGAWYDLRDYAAIPKSLAQAVGDLVVGAGTAAVQRLAAGTAGQHLVVAGDGSLQWVNQAAAPDLTPYAPKASPVFTGTVGLPTYTLATRPAASTGAGKVIYVSDASAAASIQVSNGTAWSAQGGDPNDGSVTTVKLVDGAVTTAKILDGTITGTDVQDGSLGLAELSATGTRNATTFLRGDNTFAVPVADLTALSAITPDKIAWESPVGTDIVELYGSVTAAGLALLQADQLNADTRSSYQAFDGGQPNWSGTTWNSNPLGSAFFSMAAPAAWGNASDQGKMRIKARLFGGINGQVGVGFVKPGSVAAGSVIVAEFVGGGGTARITYNGETNNGGTTLVSTGTIGAVGSTYYILELARNGNSLTITVKDATDTTVLGTATATLPVGAAQTAYGAGVDLRPFIYVGKLAGEASEVDWIEYYSVLPEQRDLFAAITPASGGTRTVRRLLGWSGNVLERSDLPLDGSVTIPKLAATGTKDVTTVLRGDNTWGIPTGNGAPNTQTANYTLALTDAGKTVEVNSASALTVTVPPNSTVALPVGTIIEVARYGAGTVAIAAGGGVTIRSRASLLSIGNQYGAVSLRKRATDEWVLVGDLA